MTVDVLHGDCLDVLPTLVAESVDACVTDPPYGLEFMGRGWDAPWQLGGKSALFGDRKIATPGGWGGTRNANCRQCGGRARGAKTCTCAKPDWDEAPETTRTRQMRAFGDWCELWAAEVFRVLKPGAHLVAFGGTRTYHRMVCAIEDAGFEIRDQLCWLYGSGFPKSHDIGKAIDKAAGAEREVVGSKLGRPGMAKDGRNQSFGNLREMEGRDDRPAPAIHITAPATDPARQWEGWGTALKPAHEPIVLARKPLAERTVAANVLKYGTGALNIDACRVTQSTGQRPEDEAWDADENRFVSSVELAEQSAKNGTAATKVYFAQKHAAPTSNGRGATSLGELSPRQDTECFGGLSQAESENTNSNIDVSGKTPTDQSSQGTRSTTSTKTGSTIGSKTCGSSRESSTGESTPYTKHERPNWRLELPPAELPTHASAKIQNGESANGSVVSTKTVEREQPSAARFPPNLLHDGSPEVLEAFARFGERAAKRGPNSAATGQESKRGVCYGNGLERVNAAHGDTGTAARFFPVLGFAPDELRLFYSGKAGKADRSGSAHPTIKPIALCRWLCRLITPPNGTILDPFCGSGTTLQAAHIEGFSAIGIEREAEYVADAQNRMREMHGPLFAGAAA